MVIWLSKILEWYSMYYLWNAADGVSRIWGQRLYVLHTHKINVRYIFIHMFIYSYHNTVCIVSKLHAIHWSYGILYPNLVDQTMRVSSAMSFVVDCFGWCWTYSIVYTSITIYHNDNCMYVYNIYIYMYACVYRIVQIMWYHDEYTACIHVFT